MTWLWVALGGAIGASLRYGLSVLLVKPEQLFPWPTWWINLFGCALAGIFFGLSQHYSSLQQDARLFFMVGVLGGFTTFSSFALETVQLMNHGHMLLALSYVLSSIVVGFSLLALIVWVLQH